MENTASTPQAPLTYSVEQVAKLLGLSRSLTYQSVVNGDLPSFRVGRRILIPRVALQRLLEARLGESK